MACSKMPRRQKSSYMDWYKTLNPDQILQLSDQLNEMDAKYRVNFDESLDKTAFQLCRDVEELMTKIMEVVGIKDPLFKSGNLIGTGSSFSGTKVCQPNEFDFLYYICTDNHCISMNNIWYAGQALDCQVTIGPRSASEKRLSASDIKQRFEVIIDTVLRNFPLSDCWIHGGYRRPKYSDFRRNGPAYMFQFTHVPSRVYVTIDLTLAVSLPLSDVQIKPVMEHVMTRDYVAENMYKMQYFKHIDMIPHISRMWTCSTSISERFGLSGSKSSDSAKRVLRLCKILFSKIKNGVNETTKSRMSDFSQTMTDLEHKTHRGRNYLPPHLGKMSVSFHNLSYLNIPDHHDDDDLNGYAPMLNVSAGGTPGSYVLQKIIMTMLLADDDTWNREEIPRHVIEVLDMLQGMITVHERCRLNMQDIITREYTSTTVIDTPLAHRLTRNLRHMLCCGKRLNVVYVSCDDTTPHTEHQYIDSSPESLMYKGQIYFSPALFFMRVPKYGAETMSENIDKCVMQLSELVGDTTTPR